VTDVARGDGIALLRRMVRIDSRNPSLVPGAPGEGELASFLRDTLTSWGFEARLQEAAPGRPNVIAVLRGSGGGRSLMFNGHLDVVGVDGMTHAPFDAEEKNGRLYGRGASDMKGGVAAMCAAAARVRGRLKGDLVIAGVVDEEWQSIGTSTLIASGVRTDAAIVTEPTQLGFMPAHKGFAWLQATLYGRAAHGSRWDIGVDAIRHAGLLLAELDRVDREELPSRIHDLLGRPSLHASFIEGGIGLSTYPDRCVLRLERRTVPGETADDALRELRAACDRVRSSVTELTADVDLLFAQPPSDVGPEAPIAKALTSVLATHRLDPAPRGMSAWTDAALLNAAGIPAVCFGPGDMGLAHAAEEYIGVDEVERGTELLAVLATAWCN
jgi:acetylornithine deacetylase